MSGRIPTTARRIRTLCPAVCSRRAAYPLSAIATPSASPRPPSAIRSPRYRADVRHIITMSPVQVGRCEAKHQAHRAHLGRGDARSPEFVRICDNSVGSASAVRTRRTPSRPNEGQSPGYPGPGGPRRLGPPSVRFRRRANSFRDISVPKRKLPMPKLPMPLPHAETPLPGRDPADIPILAGPPGAPAVTPALLDAVFRLRHEVFARRLRWQVDSVDGRERDEFDDLAPHYVVTLGPDGQVTGCCRLLPTEGPYMLRDVFAAALGGRTAPCSPDIWEISRFCVSPGQPFAGGTAGADRDRAAHRRAGLRCGTARVHAAGLLASRRGAQGRGDRISRRPPGAPDHDRVRTLYGLYDPGRAPRVGHRHLPAKDTGTGLGCSIAE